MEVSGERSTKEIVWREREREEGKGIGWNTLLSKGRRRCSEKVWKRKSEEEAREKMHWYGSMMSERGRERD